MTIENRRDQKVIVSVIADIGNNELEGNSQDIGGCLSHFYGSGVGVESEWSRSDTSPVPSQNTVDTSIAPFFEVKTVKKKLSHDIT